MTPETFIGIGIVIGALAVAVAIWLRVLFAKNDFKPVNIKHDDRFDRHVFWLTVDLLAAYEKHKRLNREDEERHRREAQERKRKACYLNIPKCCPENYSR